MMHTIIYFIIFSLLLTECETSNETSCHGTYSYYCQNEKCIHLRELCNGTDECGDNSDEAGCGRNCSGSYIHRCDKNTNCFNGLQRCDGEQDCIDNRDEKNCGKSCLDVYKIKCETETNCVSPKQYCNGVRDCEDGVDELYCGIPASKDVEDHLKDVYVAAMNMPFNISFKMTTRIGGIAGTVNVFTLPDVGGYPIPNISSLAYKDKHGHSQILTIPNQWTYTSLSELGKPPIGRLNLTLQNLTSEFFGRENFLNITNNFGTAILKFILLAKAKPRNRLAKNGLQDVYFIKQDERVEVTFEVEGIPTPNIVSIIVTDKSMRHYRLEELTQWKQIVSADDPEPWITTILLRILKSPTDIFSHYNMNVTNSEGTTAMEFEIKSEDDIKQNTDTLMPSAVSASVLLFIVVVIFVVFYVKIGRLIRARLNRTQNLESAVKTSFAVNQKQSEENGSENGSIAYAEIIEEERVDNQRNSHEYYDIKFQDPKEVDATSMCSYLEPAQTARRTSSESQEDMDFDHVPLSDAGLNTENSDYLHCIESAIIQSMELENPDYIHPTSGNPLEK